MAANDRSTVRDTVPLVPGALAGAVAFLAGYVLTFLVKSGDVGELDLGPIDQFLGSGLTPPGDWQVIGWLFYQTHSVGTSVTVRAGAGSQSTTVSGSVETWMLFVPIALLVGAGFLLARYVDAADPASGATAGAGVTVGYAPLVVVLAIVANWGVSGDALGQTVSLSVGPALMPAVLIAGLLYPILFGAAGGALAGVASR